LSSFNHKVKWSHTHQEAYWKDVVEREQPDQVTKVGAAVRGGQSIDDEKSENGSLPLVAFKIFYDLIRGIIIIMF